MANVLWNLLQNRRYKVLRYCCLTILPRFILKNEGFLLCIQKSTVFSLRLHKAPCKSSQSSSYLLLSLSCVSSAHHINQPYMVLSFQLLLHLVIPIHGAFHCFDPVFHTHFIFLPFLLWLENHFTLPQFL